MPERVSGHVPSYGRVPAAACHGTWLVDPSWPAGLAAVKTSAAAAIDEFVPIAHRCEVEYFSGFSAGPGCGKSHAIKQCYRPGDCGRAVVVADAGLQPEGL